MLWAGTYELISNCGTKSALYINRAITIEAEVPGSVVLDAKEGRRVFYIEASGTAELIGLNITGGKSIQGGGLYVAGTATLINSNIYNNLAYNVRRSHPFAKRSIAMRDNR